MNHKALRAAAASLATRSWGQLKKIKRKTVFLTLLGTLSLVLMGGVLWAVVIYQNLPSINLLTEYQPKQPLRVFTSDGVEIGQYGTERRYYLPIGQIPPLMQNALIAVEDRHFRSHSGVSPRAVMRALLANLSRARSQGGSTITQQVARTFYLTTKKNYKRKIREALLAIKIERHLSKDQVLELYMNQIFLGQRAYGFEAAAVTYFGKPLSALSIAECAMLAGLPQNPAYANPVVNFERARKRQWVVLDAMHAAGVITDAQRTAARAERLDIKRGLPQVAYAEHVAEMARQAVRTQYGEQAYTLGLKVYTSLRDADQQAAHQAVRKGVLGHERNQPYRGPEGQEELPDHIQPGDPEAASLLADADDDEDLRVALVTQASPSGVVATLASGEVVRISGDGLRMAAAALRGQADAPPRLRRGSVIRVLKDGQAWRISQWPRVEAALVAMDPDTGHVRALVGGFDFKKNQFNHASQAWRQPGSALKPFLYSAALEKGAMPATVVNDAPLNQDDVMLDAENDGGTDATRWDPKNSDGSFDGPITVRQALAKSKNLVTIRLVEWMGVEPSRQWLGRFGFEPARQPVNLTLSLGAGATTPMQLTSAYAVLANGGYRVNPVLITRITDGQDRVLFEAPNPPRTETERVIPARNAFVTSSLLQEVTRSGTAALAQRSLRRTDLYGKTGTTNNAVDTWFAGYQPSLVAVVWMGYDDPRSLGSNASGSSLALPVWLDFMRQGLRGVPVQDITPTEHVQQVNGDWVYSEWADGGYLTDLGLEEQLLPSWWPSFLRPDPAPPPKPPVNQWPAAPVTP